MRAWAIDRAVHDADSTTRHVGGTPGKRTLTQSIASGRLTQHKSTGAEFVNTPPLESMADPFNFDFSLDEQRDVGHSVIQSQFHGNESSQLGSSDGANHTTLPGVQRKSISSFAELPVLQLRSGGASHPAEEHERAQSPAAGGGRPLPEVVRLKMERALGADFSAVRIHEGPEAEAQGALAFAQGTNIYFAPGRYQPETPQGQELLGHELGHVVQQAQGRVQATRQGKGVAINDDAGLEREADEMGARAARASGSADAPVQAMCATCGAPQGIAAEDHGSSDVAASGCTACGTKGPIAAGAGKSVIPMQMKVDAANAAGGVVQRWPGDGMRPPGDCDWAKYLVLLGAVESAKAVVSQLGACAIGDDCTTLAMKIAAIATEIAARSAREATCFRGGDTTHRQQIQEKINMMNRCYRFFSQSRCPQQIFEAMERVVEKAMEVIVVAAVVALAVVAIAALVAALIALVEAIIAAAATAAVAATAAAVLLLLMTITEQLSPSSSPGQTA